MAWLPIDTAPQDGTKFDIWVIAPSGNGYRIADVMLSRTLSGLHLMGNSNRVSPYMRPTHWMPIPEGP